MSFLAKLVVLLGLICVGISQTIMDLVDATPTLSTLKSLLETTGLNNTLSQPGTYTVFAPTDDAFDAVTNLGDIVERFGGATNILLYHVLGIVVTSEDLSPGLIANTLFDGAIVTALVDVNITAIVDITGGISNVETADVEATNGIVHIMDAVLVPGTIAEYAISNPAVSTLVTALVTAGLVDVLNATNTTFTVLAPVNDAFNGVNQAVLNNAVAGGNPTFLSNLLTTHVIDTGAPVLSNELTDGQEIPTLSTANVTATVNGTGVFFLNNVYPYYAPGEVIIPDIIVVGGVIHAIDSVLRFEPDDVVDIVANDADLSTLTSLVVAQNLTEILQGAANFTVFAPDNAAFDNISAVTPNLVDSEISATLQYHVLPITALSTDITTNLNVTSVNGLPLTVGPENQTVFVQAVASCALVTVADLTSGNGVVHKVNTVLLPFGSITDVVADESDLSTLSAALGATDFGTEFNNVTNLYTLFAPDDDAFAALLILLNVTAEELLADTNLLNLVLPYHAITSRAFSTDLTYGEALDTVSGGQLIVNIDADTSDNSMTDTISFIDDQGNFVEVVEADVPSLNGVIHKLSSVLLPNTAVPSPGSIVNGLYTVDDLSTLKDAVVLAELLRTLGTTTPLTVLAPNNAAFDALGSTLNNLLSNVTILTQVLTYHVIAGNITSGDLVNGTTATTLNGETLLVLVNDDGSVQFVDKIGGVSTVVLADVIFTNGIVHVIDNVLELEEPSVMSYIIKRDDLSTLQFLLETTGLNNTLDDDGTFTIFAPTDTAFNTLSENYPAIFSLLTNPNDTTALTDALLYHVLGEIRLSTSLSDGDRLTTLFGNTIFNQFVTVNTEGGVTLTESYIPSRGLIITITEVDFITLNGVVHIIDTVLVPNLLDIGASLPVLGLNTLLTALDSTNLTQVLSNATADTRFTLFGPTDEALAAVSDLINSLTEEELTNVLLLHATGTPSLLGSLNAGRNPLTPLVDGTIIVYIGDDEAIVFGGSANATTFNTTDVQTTTGLIQVINGVFLPGPGPVTATLTELGYTELLKYLEQTSLDLTVDSEEALTVFAPDNEAFNISLDVDNDELEQILLYHVVSGKVFSFDLSNEMVIETLQGSTVTVSINDDGIAIIDGEGRASNVILANQNSSNAVIHGLDSVLFLPASAPSEGDDDSGLEGWQWALIIVAIVVVVGIVGYVVANQCGLCKKKGGDAQPLLDGTEQ